MKNDNDCKPLKLVETTNALLELDRHGQVRVYLAALCQDPNHLRDNEVGLVFWHQLTELDLVWSVLIEFARCLRLMPTERDERMDMLARVLAATFAPERCHACELHDLEETERRQVPRPIICDVCGNIDDDNGQHVVRLRCPDCDALCCEECMPAGFGNPCIECVSTRDGDEDAEV